MNARSRILKGGLSALLCLCMVMGNFGGVATALAAENGVPAVNTDRSNLGDLSYDPSVKVDPVTLLAGNSDLRGNSIQETIEKYRSKYMLGVAADFCVFLEDYFWVLESDAEGRVAIGGDFYPNTPWAFNYTIGAGDFWWHVPLNELLVDSGNVSNRDGAATVIIGGNMYGQLNDTYYASPRSTAAITWWGYRAKYEAGGVFDNHDYAFNWKSTEGDENWERRSTLTPKKKSEKKLVIQDLKGKSTIYEFLNQTPSDALSIYGNYWTSNKYTADSPDGRNDDSYRVTAVPEINDPGNYQKIDRRQTYYAQLINFADSFKYLKKVSSAVALADENHTNFEISELKDDRRDPAYPRDKTKRISNKNGEKTLVLTYNGNGETLEDCVYLTLTAAQFELFRQATYIEFENIPNLTKTRYEVEIKDSGAKPKDNVYLESWPYAYIVVSVEGKGPFEISDLDKADGQKHTCINGTYISRTNPEDQDLAKNNHYGVTSLLYNFPQATTIYLGNNFQGTIFAPNAHVTDLFTKADMGNNDGNKRGHLSGALIAKSFKGATQFGYRPFTGPAFIFEGGLEISKKVVGTTTNEPFSFRITLKDYKVGDEKQGSKEKLGEMEFVVKNNDSVAEFTLTNGQKKTATGIPIGVVYEVEETSNLGQLGFTASHIKTTGVVEGTSMPGVKVEGDKIVQGNPDDNKGQKVEFINTYSEDGGDDSGNGDDSDNEDESGNTVDNAPKTGDTFSPALWLGLMAISLMGIGISSRAMRREKARR